VALDCLDGHVEELRINIMSTLQEGQCYEPQAIQRLIEYNTFVMLTLEVSIIGFFYDSQK